LSLGYLTAKLEVSLNMEMAWNLFKQNKQNNEHRWDWCTYLDLPETQLLYVFVSLDLWKEHISRLIS